MRRSATVAAMATKADLPKRPLPPSLLLPLPVESKFSCGELAGISLLLLLLPVTDVAVAVAAAEAVNVSFRLAAAAAASPLNALLLLMLEWW